MRMPLTPKDLSFLAASAPRAGSGGGLVTRKVYSAPNPQFEEWGRGKCVRSSEIVRANRLDVDAHVLHRISNDPR
jgi:hypothetical protein